MRIQEEGGLWEVTALQPFQIFWQNRGNTFPPGFPSDTLTICRKKEMSCILYYLETSAGRGLINYNNNNNNNNDSNINELHFLLSGNSGWPGADQEDSLCLFVCLFILFVCVFYYLETLAGRGLTKRVHYLGLLPTRLPRPSNEASLNRD